MTTAHTNSHRRGMMKLGAFMWYDGNYNLAAWRRPDAYADAGHNISRWIECARILERGKMDMLFVADYLSPPGFDHIDTMSQSARSFGFEPVTLLSALSLATSRLGLAGTISTTWNEPYTVARMTASLDHRTGGRAGWNIVTGRNPDDAKNFSKEEHMEHDARYGRAEEFVDVVMGLWDTFEDDAFVMNRDTGYFFDPKKIHGLNHKGTHFSVRGPLGVARPPQGYPVRIVAGDSEPGRQLAGRVADVVFTSKTDITVAQAFYADIRKRAESFGRDPDSVKILPGLTPYIGRTRAEAEEKYERLAALLPLPYAIRQLGSMLGCDLSGFPADGPIPEVPAKTKRNTSTATFLAPARRANLTLGQAALRACASKSHFSVKGTAADIADQMEDWFLNRAADGFNILPPQIPGDLEDFVDLVIPELRRRGLFRSEYEGATLRDLLGLTRPDNSLALRDRSRV